MILLIGCRKSIWSVNVLLYQFCKVYSCYWSNCRYVCWVVKQEITVCIWCVIEKWFA